MNDMRYTWVAAALLASAPVMAAAQQCGADVETVGSIGISLLDCDCVIGAPFSAATWEFRSEPRIARIQRGSPADGQLQVGDVIKTVGDVGIMTPAGARLLSVIRAGQPISIEVERNGETIRRVLTATSLCADDPNVLGTYAPRVALTQAAVARTDVERAAVARSGRTPTAVAPAVQGARARVTSTDVERRAVEVRAAHGVAPASTVPSTSAWIGLGFSCSDCSMVQEEGGPRWTFRTPPTVYSVEVGSPAYGGPGAAGMRRGDILTHIDGLDITTAAGGKRLGTVKPGETVRVRYRRPTQGSGPVTRELTFVAGPARSPTATAVSSLNRAVVALTTSEAQLVPTMRSYEAARREAAEQQLELTRVVERLRSGNVEEQRMAEERLRDLLTANAEVQRRQNMLVQELVATQRSGQALEASRRSLNELTVAGVRSPAADQRLRYSGVFGTNDVEVRGLSNVVVTERGDELIITTSDATIRLKKPVVRR